MKHEERGSVFPFVMLLAGVMIGLLMLLALVAGALQRQSVAQTAADAAALAGANSGHDAAVNAAAANHAVLVYFNQDGSDTQVTAKVGASTKSARARRSGVQFQLGSS